MPRLVDDAGDVSLVRLIPDDKAILPAVLRQPGNGTLPQQIHGKPQMVLAGTGKSHGFPGLGVGLIVVIAPGHIFLCPGGENLRLGVDAAVGGVENHFVSGIGAVLNHLPQGFQTGFVHLMPTFVYHQLPLQIAGNTVALIYQYHMDSVRGEEVGVPADGDRPHSSGAVLLQIVAVFSILIPSGVHQTFFAEEVAFSFNFLPAEGSGAVGGVVPAAILGVLPAGVHTAVIPEVVLLVVELHPAGEHTAVTLEVVGVVPLNLPAHGHGTVLGEEVGVRFQLQPAGGHGACFPEIIPLAFQFQPSGVAAAVGIEVVPVSVDIRPQGRHGAIGRGEVVGFALHLLPAGVQRAVGTEVVAAAVNVLPVGGHGLILCKIVSVCADILPAGTLFSVKIPVIVAAVFGNPAASVYGVVVDQPGENQEKKPQTQRQNPAQSGIAFTVHNQVSHGELHFILAG